MTTEKTDLTTLIKKYFDQQLQLYGDGYILTRPELSTLESLLRRNNRLTQPPMPVTKISQAFNLLAEPVAALRQFHQQIKDCQNCSLGSKRKNFVFGVGNPQAKLMLIGEAPGEEEDKQGEPFVGRAGLLLNKILASINFKREEVYIANILKCRPPNNRDPLPQEVEQCEPYLHQQIRLIQPKVILALGRISGQTLLKTKQTLTYLRGKLQTYQGIPMVVTFHPAALLRNPNWKYPAWDDVRYLRRVYDAILANTNLESVQFEKLV